MTRAVEDGSKGSLEGVVGGLGRFAEGPDGVPIIALPDVQNLTLVRERIVEELRERGIESPSEHGFLPHMTLTYAAGDEPIDLEHVEEKLGLPVTFDAISLVVTGRRTDYALQVAVAALA